MKRPVKKQLVTPLLVLSILMITPNMVFSTEGSTNTDSKSILGLIPPKKLLASLLLVIPLWQLYKKSSKAQIPPENEYSWPEIMTSTGTLWSHFVSNPAKRLFCKSNKKYSEEEVKDAAKMLWKNIKNLYHMGFVGQLKMDKILTLYKGKYLQCTPKAPARGVLGNLVYMLNTSEKTYNKLLSLIAIWIVIFDTKRFDNFKEAVKKWSPVWKPN